MRLETSTIRIESLEPIHYDEILRIVENLPEWFDETARTRSLPTDLRYQIGFVAASDQRVAGFITLYVTEGRLHIGWLAVDKRMQRQGLGSLLLESAESKARQLGIDELATYTLGESVSYPPYEMTRSFYRKHGFRVYKRTRTDNPGCPEEIWISKRVKP